jgi:hypothetical protein
MRAAGASAAEALLDGWSKRAPEALLLVDRAALVDALVGAGISTGEASPRIGVVSADGEPPAILAWWRDRFRVSAPVPILYLHDAATVLYPFAIEPVATLIASRRGSKAIAYADLGLPPLGATARRFRDPAVPPDAVVTKLDALSPRTLAAYVVDAAKSLLAEAGARTLTNRDALRRGP